MSRIQWMQRLPQRLPSTVNKSERDFFERAMQARRKPTREETIAQVQAHRQRELEEERQWRRDERQWKREFEEWWKKRCFQHSTAGTKRRMALYQTSVMTLTREEWQAIKARYQHRCAYCQQRPFGTLTQDHIVPISKGGFHTRINVIPACKSCNSKKGARPAFRYKPTLIPF